MILGGMLALVGGSLINLLIPELVRRYLNTSSLAYLAQNFWGTIGVLILIIAVQGVCFYYRALIFSLLGHRIVNQLRKTLYSSLLNQDIAYFDQNKTGDFVSRLNSDTQALQNAVSLNLSVILRYSLQIVAGVTMMCIISARLALMLSILLLLLLGLSFSLVRKLKLLSRIMQEQLAVTSSIAEETTAAMRTIKAFANEKFQESRYHQATENLYQAAHKRTQLSSFFSSFVSFLMNCSILIVLYYGISLNSQSILSLGDLTGFALYAMLVAVSFAFTISAVSEFVQALGAAERIFEIIDQKPFIQNNIKATSPALQVHEISFENISFAYPSRPDQLVIKDVSLKIKQGQKIALVGSSGSGKSTLVNLLLRFYEPNSGSIKINNQAINSLNLKSLRQGIGLVPQDPQIFAMSIADNLRLGKEDAAIEELQSACSQANILDFINSLPQAFNTYVGDRGVQLSGGQRQRIAIARAILKNPSFLILDEATSALDSENEYEIRQALEKLMHDRGSLIIAHRLSTIQNADLVIVLEDGKIIAQGKHAELASENGTYRQMLSRQELKVAS